ncbi:Cytochrome P450-33C9 [Aphelenchoides bicaudatus]|nr:Cytochrome P450-33C9 [Aphelenchoides bicaudatus]
MLIYLAIFAITAYLYWHFIHKRRGLPPGPIPLPLFGNFHEILFEPPGEAVYSRWRKQYGDVYTYWMGNLPVVSVNDFKLIIDTFQKDGDAYAGRWKFEDFDTMARAGPNGVIFTDQEVWREQRRFALMVLRDFGLGKNLMQERVLDEIHTIFENVDRDVASDLKEHDLYNHVDVAVGSIINVLLFGYRFHGEKEHEFFDLKTRVQAHINSIGHPLVFMSMTHPYFYKRLPFFKQKLETSAETGQYLVKFFRDRIEEHEKNFDINEEPTDYVNAFLKEWKKQSESDKQHFFSHKQLTSMCYDLWVAGQETTSNTLAWGFAFMVHHQEALRRCQEELDKVIGSDRLINLSDKPNLHYCNATINEIQRLANLVPMNVWHRTTKEVTIDGHRIPKDVAIVPQISVVLSDEKIFPNPLKFDPERFLDSEGKLKKSEELIPFSIGKRACLGESLARMELFLFFVNIINRYNLTPGKELPNLTRRFGGTANIDRYVCRVQKRVH